MCDYTYFVPYVNQDDGYDAENEMSSQDSPPHTQDTDSSGNNGVPSLDRQTYITSPPHTQDTESSGDKRMPVLERETYMTSLPHTQDSESFGDNRMPSLDRETDMASPPHTDQDTETYDLDNEMSYRVSETNMACQGIQKDKKLFEDSETDAMSEGPDTFQDEKTLEPGSSCASKETKRHTQDIESFGDNRMQSLDRDTDMASPPHTDQDTESYDLDSEMSYRVSETNIASQGILKEEKLSQDSETDAASEGPVKFQDEKTQEPGSSCPSKETKKTGASASGKNKNELSPKNNLFENDDHSSINKADRDSPDADSGSSDRDKYSSEEFLETVCDICFKKFSDREQLWGHKIIQSPSVTYSCEECHRSFNIECNFECHKLFDHTPDLFSPEKWM